MPLCRSQAGHLLAPSPGGAKVPIRAPAKRVRAAKAGLGPVGWSAGWRLSLGGRGYACPFGTNGPPAWDERYLHKDAQ